MADGRKRSDKKIKKRGLFLRKFKLLLLRILMAFCSKIVYSEEELEEVVVKGFYLKRTAADSASPVSVMTDGEIEDFGVADIAEIVQSIP